jgi:thioredoxin-dependent peroxiredoxin
MTTIYLKGEKVNTCGDIPDVGETAKEFVLVNEDLREVKLSDFDGKIKILNIFPSVDTATCSHSVKKFAHEAVKISADVVILQISADLPFAHKRFCVAEDLHTRALSTFRSTFANDYG